MRHVALIAVAVLALVTLASGIILPRPTCRDIGAGIRRQQRRHWMVQDISIGGTASVRRVPSECLSFRHRQTTNNPEPMSVEVLAALLQATAASPANQGSTKYAPAARRMQKQ